MLPVFNSLAYHSTRQQTQTNGITASAPQQVMLSNNQLQGNNNSNLLAQIQSQMGIINPQMSIPFNNSSTHLVNNANNSFLNVPNNQFLSLQNGQLASGFGQQILAMNQFNMSQLNGQLFAQNSISQAQYFNQNVNLPNGQFYLQAPMQNLGQFVQMQIPNRPMFQGVMGFNAQQEQKSHNTKQLQGSSSLQPAFPQHTQNFRSPIFNNKQGTPRKDNANNSTTCGKNFQSRNVTRHPKHDASQGFTKSQAHHMQNAKGKFKFQNEHGGKGYKNEGARKSDLISPSNQTEVDQKISLPLSYTEQEIMQWREARKRNYPSKTNLEKKLTKKMAEAELTDKDAELRRQQLKEVLAKQAALGCEVAEIPSHYLLNSEKQVDGLEEKQRPFNKKGRSRNKFNKRVRHENDRFTKKQRPSDIDSGNFNDQNNVFNNTQRIRNNDSSTGPVMKKREPTLLQKLLTADLRRDKGRLLQVFRFMVMNSFFKDRPEKPLRFPLVMVKETEGKGELVEEKSSNIEEVGFEGEKTITGECTDNGDNEYNFSEAVVNETKDIAREECSVDKAFEGAEEEEGEIID